MSAVSPGDVERRGGSVFVDAVRKLAAPVSRTRTFRRVGPRVLPPLERLLKKITGGRVQVSGLLVPTLVLSSVGAKTGTARDTVLMYTPDGRGRAIVAGTSFAREKHPAWTYNLMVNPDAVITVRKRRLAVRALPVADADRDAAWQRIERQWPGYRSYERASGRKVRLFLLQPVREEPPETGSDAGLSPRARGARPPGSART